MTPRRILAVTATSLRGALRSRFAPSAALLLALLLAGLLVGVRGDGTQAGRLRMLLTYGLGTGAVVTGAVTLWMACLAISTEIANHRLHLVVVKPVSHAAIWLGKWLAIGIVAAALLLETGLALWAVAALARTHSTAEAPETAALQRGILTARQPYHAQFKGVDARVEARLAELVAAGKLPADVPESVVRADLRHAARVQQSVIRADRPVLRQFALPAAVPGLDRPAILEFQSFSRVRDLPPHPAALTFRTTEGAVLGSVPFRMRLTGRNRIEIPPACLAPGQTITVELSLQDAETVLEETSLLIEPGRPFLLLTEAGSLEANLLRGLLLTWCGCMVLAAVGLTLGTVFSPPVASFAAAALTVVYLAAAAAPLVSGADHEHQHHHHDESPTPVARALGAASEQVLAGVRRATAPLLTLRRRGRVAAGIRIAWREPATAWVVLLGGYGGLCAVLGSLAMRRRELAGAE